MATDAPVDVLSNTGTTLVLSEPVREPCDVHFDGQRVLAMGPKDFRTTEDGATYAWPPDLRKYLHGQTRLLIREHVSGRLLVDTEISFDDSGARTSVKDAAGHPLAVDKTGWVSRMFDSADASAIGALLDVAERLISDIEDFGAVAFIAYGTLLGAARNGKLIGHDNDVDLNYFSHHNDPVSIVRESLAMERFLQERGWYVDRPRASFIRVRVNNDSDAGGAYMDVFMCFHDGTRLYIDQFVWAEVPVDSIVPTSKILLEGKEMTAPRDPAVMLSAIYGPEFLVPDPTFKHNRRREQIRATTAWFGNFRLGRTGWRRYLAETVNDPATTSDLVQLAQDRRSPTGVVVDVATGHGHDALALARQGIPVIATDHVPEALTPLRQVASAEKLDLRCWAFSFSDPRSAIVHGARLAALPDPAGTVLTVNDLLDVLQYEARNNFWQFTRTALLAGGRLLVSVRDEPRCTDEDRPEQPGPWIATAEQIRFEAERAGGHVVDEIRTEDRTILEVVWKQPA